MTKLHGVIEKMTNKDFLFLLKGRSGDPGVPGLPGNGGEKVRVESVEFL